MKPTSIPVRAAATLLAAGLLPAAVFAQQQQPPPAAPDAAASAPVQRVEITGGRGSEVEQRRRSTAAKIVIGRDEIEQFGDSTVGEVLRRLPGVTTPGGRPGRGGPPRLRGLGGGYTQLLIDGEPIPRGFSLESLTPDQVERIEILRAPTAETGARAIAGTINIVLREGYKRRLNDLRVGIGVEHGLVTPGAFWTWNDTVAGVATNLNAGLFLRRNDDRSTVESDTTGGDEPGRWTEARTGESTRRGINLGARLQWRLGPGGDSLLLSPSLFRADNRGRSTALRDTQAGDVLYERADETSEGSFTNLRLNGQWKQRLGPGRVEGSLTGGLWRSENTSRREETSGGTLLRRLDEDNDVRERSLRLSGKYSVLLGDGDDAKPGTEAGHSGVGGFELETGRRTEARGLRQDGMPLLTDFGDNLAADSLRLALYAQDEWTPTPNWALHFGLRWEAIRTEGDPGDGTRPTHLDRVLTPLAHAVWKPDPASRSQVRMSLTRSWRAPGLGNLIARPRPNDRYPLDGPNTPTAPDRAGNPDLRPELATGIDLAWEHYPKDGGVFSVSVFHRRIRDLMRTVVDLEDVPWAGVPRWVARTRNVGDATTQGIELEAKGRLDQWWTGAPRTELRANASFFRSRVDGLPGPDNRLEQQPDRTLNLGADHPWRGLPLKTGINLNWVPGYRTRTSDEQVVEVSSRRVVDVYALWTVEPGVALRLSAGNALPRDSDDLTSYDDGSVRSTVRTNTPSDIGWQLRLELKL